MNREKFEVWLNPLWHLETFKGSDDSLQYRDEVIQGKWETWQAASKASEQRLAAVVAELSAIEAIHNDAVFITDEHYEQCPPEAQKIIGALAVLKIPAYDAYLAEVRTNAREEGINYAASRLAAAYNHGFVDKPLAEVYDVVRMILTAKEDLTNDPASGEYAEKSLVEFAAQLRQGGEHE
ncbi:hypothetical protein [Kluyvera sichuanensis]|uniref:hypothetical protein n=1 Tax=Kluyvera sichuanensis TaxID=2725494 RepID=UPI0034A36E74